MARGQHVATNGVHSNGDAPPPSTLAAQIVQNQAQKVTNQAQGEAASFRDLLHEILHSNGAAPETDVDVNAQLVNVVIQAGLVPLTLDNPFADWDVLLPQAMDSIAVVESTIRRQPEVLLHRLTPDGPQLILSILATLISLCGKHKCEQIPVDGLLVSSLNALEKSTAFWRQARDLSEVIQHCVDEILSVLETNSLLSNTVNIGLPPARGLAYFWPQAEGSIALPQGSTSIVTEVARAFIIALDLCRVPGLAVPWTLEACLRLQGLAMPLRTQLAKASRWDYVVQRLLQLPYSWVLAAVLLKDIVKTPASTTNQKLLAAALVRILHTELDDARDSIVPVLRLLPSDEVWKALQEDLKIAIATWIIRVEPAGSVSANVIALSDSLRTDDAMIDSELHQSFKQLSVAAPCNSKPPRLRKRRKLSNEGSGSRQSAVARRVSQLLAGVDSQDLTALPDVAVSVYATLQPSDQCSAWQYLADLAEYDHAVTMLTVGRLVKGIENRQNKQARVLALLAMRACLQRTIDPLYIDISSDFAQHILSSLCSSVRELRTAAAQSVSAFIRNDLPETIRTKNRQAILEHLRAASTRDMPSEQETLVTAWGQVAISCGDEELNLALLQLVEYLGHGNAFVCAMAFSELEAIAGIKGLSHKELFQPFWRSIAVSVVQELHSKPQKAQQLCDLLGIDVNGFLVLTQRETLPFLVLAKKKDILQRIANARGNGTTVEDVCMQPRTNLAAILALLLSQSTHEAEEFAYGCLTEVAPDLKKTDISSLVKVDPVLVACEILKLSGEQTAAQKSRAYQAFQIFANIAERAPGQRRAHTKPSKAVSQFLDDKVLGILTLFSTMLESGPGAESTLEKIRCLRGMADMFVIAKGKLSFALPQIRGCLQSGLEQTELCEVAFEAWLSLIPLLEADDVALIVDETFVLITRHWSALSTEMQQKTHETLSQLVKTNNTLLQENIMTLPSLDGIPLLSKFAAEFERFRLQQTIEMMCKAFTARLRDDSDIVVLQSIKELVPFLDGHQEFIHDTAASEHPSPLLSDLLCALLDVTVKYSTTNSEAADLCGRALGIIGCLDPNRIEATRRKGHILVLSNFDKASEVIDWVIALLQHVLVKSFKSVTNAKSQGFLAYTMQELLGFCNFSQVAALRPRASQAPEAATKWYDMPEHIRTALTPLLTSRYVVTSNSAVNPPERTYPGFSADASHSSWLRSITYDLMFKGKGDNAKAIFTLLARVIRGQDLAIARFLFPYAVLNVVIGGTSTEVQDLTEEFMAVLQASPESPTQQENIRLCSESVFTVLDYMSTWLREKRKELGETRIAAYKTGVSPNEFDEARDIGQIETVENFLASIPAEIIANQAIDCRSYARALFHWEQYIRQERDLIPSGKLTPKHETMYDRLQEIYTQIEEPDGLEGIAAHLPLISEQQQTINHAKAGRWTAAQAWYELQLAEQPTNTDIQHEILQCQKETGQYATLLRYANSFLDPEQSGENVAAAMKTHLPLAVEACWMTEDFESLKRRMLIRPDELQMDFNLGIGQSLLCVADVEQDSVLKQIKALRCSITESLSMASTESLQTCHAELMKLHVLYEIEALSTVQPTDASRLVRALEKRLNVVGAYVQDKQFILGTRRAVMRLHPAVFKAAHTGASWLTTARLARQSKNITSAYNAVLKAYECSERGSKVEEARLLWIEGHQRQAIQALEAAIESGVLEAEDPGSSLPTDGSAVSSGWGEINGHKQNPLMGKALLLLAKWLDASGQSQTKDMTDRYQLAARRHQRWEKGHYYLGKHYTKLLDAQKALPKEKQTQSYLTGELTKLVIDNSLRSVPFGNKYWHETIPRVLTLWLQLGMDCLKQTRGEEETTFEKRKKSLQACNKQLQKYFERVPPYVFYHALPQLISRITHPHPDVWKQLCNILVRIASTHPSQTLWSLLAVPRATDKLRVERGKEVLNKLKDPKHQPKHDSSNVDLKSLIAHSLRLCDGLLLACEQPIEPRAVHVSLSKDLAFKLNLAPSNLVVPVESTLTAAAPPAANSESIRRHKAFTQDKITIQSFQDEVLVLNSLQRPRKITVRGSDGKLYSLLCKPKDDLRKDQRLMEFNGIINRALKRNTESSKRSLYIKTYAVTPLSEESGSIEWVEGIKPLRDILLHAYQRKGIRPNYGQIKKDLDLAAASEDDAHIFAKKVLSQFEPVLHEWFTETYSEPEMWFHARLRYARSAAVMSIVGHILGLGDRHGENILLMEGTGGVFHVDFNCLFDKGLTFEKPELVPFRLTHNMVDAMGPYGYEGPFRKSSELTLGLLRQERDTLMTVLETFLYDPTADFVDKKKKRTTPGVPDTPAEILESVSTKLKGLLIGETVPLSAEGYVDALIQQATNHFRLASMYIGWCSFL